jgi:hypothetical protein
MLLLYILHFNTKYAEQNRDLLDTLRIHQSNNNRIILSHTPPSSLGIHSTHEGHMRVSSWPFVPRKLQQTNRQDMVFIRPPGIFDGAFQLRMDNIRFCKLLLLSPDQSPYKERHWHAVPRVRLCFSAGRVQGPTKIRSHSAYFAYFAYSNLLIDLSLAGSVSSCNLNRLRTP